MATDTQYRELSVEHIVLTARTLENRITERFPKSGLSRVAGELERVARDAEGVARFLARPILPLRIAIAVGSLLLLLALALGLSVVQLEFASKTLGELAQTVEAMVNDMAFIGIGLFFLVSVEGRIKRRRALKALHVLRSLAHIVDMHQLTKDPERLLVKGPDTESSPKREMTAFQLTRYLDYCSELLSIISKIGAVYVQHFDDTATVDAASSVESLTVGLSRKVWQKIILLDRIVGGQDSKVVG